jgi:hypothetical protein
MAKAYFDNWFYTLTFLGLLFIIVSTVVGVMSRKMPINYAVGALAFVVIFYYFAAKNSAYLG